MQPNKTDRTDAAGLAQIVRTGWFKPVQIKTRASYEVRSLLAARDALVQIRVKLENEIRGLLRTFGVLFGKAVGGFSQRADALVAVARKLAGVLHAMWKTKTPFRSGEAVA